MKVQLTVLFVLIALVLVTSYPKRKSNPKEELMMKGKPEHAHIDTNKIGWSDLVGKNADEAMAVIQKDRPDLKVYKLPKVSVFYSLGVC